MPKKHHTAKTTPRKGERITLRIRMRPKYREALGLAARRWDPEASVNEFMVHALGEHIEGYRPNSDESVTFADGDERNVEFSLRVPAAMFYRLEAQAQKFDPYATVPAHIRRIIGKRISPEAAAMEREGGEPAP